MIKSTCKLRQLNEQITEMVSILINCKTGMKHLSNYFFKKRETDESENDRIHLKNESK